MEGIDLRVEGRHPPIACDCYPTPPMSESPQAETKPVSHSNRLQERLERVGTDLATSFRGLLDLIPGTPHRPNRLAKLFEVNRAVTSRLLTATSKENPLEVLHLIPGPEPLRKVTARLAELKFEGALLAVANSAIDAFDSLIAEEAGTRPALDALISPQLLGAAERLELTSRYAIFKGISQLKGVQGDLWLGVAVVAPSKTDSDRFDLTWINGAVAMQRLRPGVDVRFSFRIPKEDELGEDEKHNEDTPSPASIIPLEEYCVNPPAKLETKRVGEAIHFHLPADILGPKDKVDMFVVDHHPSSMRRYADPEAHRQNRAKTSLFVEIAVPVANLVFDVILHEDAFPGSTPELFLYDTGYYGVANVNDPERDHDRVAQVVPLQELGSDMTQFSSDELASYSPMLLHLAARFGWDPKRFRGYRLNMQYPVFGWQVSMAFQQPLKSD